MIFVRSKSFLVQVSRCSGFDHFRFLKMFIVNLGFSIVSCRVLNLNSLCFASPRLFQVRDISFNEVREELITKEISN